MLKKLRKAVLQTAPEQERIALVAQDGFRFKFFKGLNAEHHHHWGGGSIQSVDEPPLGCIKVFALENEEVEIFLKAAQLWIVHISGFFYALLVLVGGPCSHS